MIALWSSENPPYKQRERKTERSRAKLAPQVPSQKKNTKHRAGARAHRGEEQEEQTEPEMTQQFHLQGCTPQQIVSCVSVYLSIHVPSVCSCMCTQGVFPQEPSTFVRMKLVMRSQSRLEQGASHRAMIPSGSVIRRHDPQRVSHQAPWSPAGQSSGPEPHHLVSVSLALKVQACVRTPRGWLVGLFVFPFDVFGIKPRPLMQQAVSWMNYFSTQATFQPLGKHYSHNYNPQQLMSISGWIHKQNIVFT